MAARLWIYLRGHEEYVRIRTSLRGPQSTSNPPQYYSCVAAYLAIVFSDFLLLARARLLTGIGRKSNLDLKGETKWNEYNFCCTIERTVVKY